MKNDPQKKGWKSSYDYEHMMNVEKYMGRKLYVQDNFWFLLKILLGAFAGLIAYLILDGDLNIHNIINFFDYYK